MTTAQQFQTTIIESDFDGIAPVYQHYAGQHQPQLAYIRMDEDGQIDTWVNGEIGNAVPASVWHNRTLTWRVPADARGEALLAFVKDHQRLFERVWQGHKVEWNGNNWVGKLTEDAKAAYEEIEAACSDIETIDVICMQDWLRAGRNNHFTDFWDGEYTLDEAASKAEDDAREALSEGVWVKDPQSARSELLEWAADEFRNHPERLSARHFEALIDECEISFEEAVEVINDEELDISLRREINDAGAQEILAFLQASHKRGAALGDKELAAWVADADFQLAEGNTPSIEVRAADSVHGHACTYTVSDAGVSVRATQL